MFINTSVATTRSGMSARCRLGMLVAGSAVAAGVAAVATYTPFNDARNGAQGRHRAWSPPV